MPRTRPLVIGHRGAPGYRPEHSRSSYDLAFAMIWAERDPDYLNSADANFPGAPNYRLFKSSRPIQTFGPHGPPVIGRRQCGMALLPVR